MPRPEVKGGVLRTARRLAAQLGVEVRNPKWTSYGALELDAFVPSRGDFDLLVAALEPLARLEFSRDLSKAPRPMSLHETAAEAKALFDSERYWECHEVLEGAWRGSAGEAKLHVQGVILVCAAFVHHQKGEDQVALGVLRRAAAQLPVQGLDHLGIDPKVLRGKVDAILASGRFVPFRL